MKCSTANASSRIAANRVEIKYFLASLVSSNTYLYIVAPNDYFACCRCLSKCLDVVLQRARLSHTNAFIAFLSNESRSIE